MSIFVHIAMSKARVAAFEAALTDRVHLGADNYGPVVGRTTRAMGDGRTLQQTRCHCGSIWDGHTWGPGKKEWEAHVGSMRHLAWVQSARWVGGSAGWSTGPVGRVDQWGGWGGWGWLHCCLGSQNVCTFACFEGVWLRNRACGALFLFSKQGARAL